MEEIIFIVPYPPSVNKAYSTSSKGKIVKGGKNAGKIYFPRRLSPESLAYKKFVSQLIFFSFLKVKYDDHPVEIEIIVNSPDDNRTRDDHNCEKILYDAIQESGIIKNDKQIVKRTIMPGIKIGKGSWIVKMNPYYGYLEGKHACLEFEELIKDFHKESYHESIFKNIKHKFIYPVIGDGRDKDS